MLSAMIVLLWALNASNKSLDDKEQLWRKKRRFFLIPVLMLVSLMSGSDAVPDKPSDMKISIWEWFGYSMSIIAMIGALHWAFHVMR